MRPFLVDIASVHPHLDFLSPDDRSLYADTVLEFDVVNMDWVVRPERLNVARSSAFVTAVDAELYCDP